MFLPWELPNLIYPKVKDAYLRGQSDTCSYNTTS
jgi:hypothetical protein